jgi:hypothetical protein
MVGGGRWGSINVVATDNRWGQIKRYLSKEFKKIRAHLVGSKKVHNRN